MCWRKGAWARHRTQNAEKYTSGPKMSGSSSVGQLRRWDTLHTLDRSDRSWSRAWSSSRAVVWGLCRIRKVRIQPSKHVLLIEQCRNYRSHLAKHELDHTRWATDLPWNFYMKSESMICPMICETFVLKSATPTVPHPKTDFEAKIKLNPMKFPMVFIYHDNC